MTLFSFVSILIILVGVLLTLIVLVQNSKGGGLASNFSGSNKVMGVRKTTDFLEKGTWGLAAVLLVLCVVAAGFIPREQDGLEQSRVQEQIETAIDPTQVPTFPSTPPAAAQETPAAKEEGEK